MAKKNRFDAPRGPMPRVDHPLAQKQGLVVFSNQKGGIHVSSPKPLRHPQHLKQL
jgi:hypothetical protein